VFEKYSWYVRLKANIQMGGEGSIQRGGSLSANSKRVDSAGGDTRGAKKKKEKPSSLYIGKEPVAKLTKKRD